MSLSSALPAVRAFGVMLGGPVALAAAALASLAASARAVARGRHPAPLALAGVVGLVAHVVVIRRWIRHWGATPDERRAVLPGDELVPDPGMETTRAVTIDAPVERVWPWLAQIGQDRGGFYSYEWLENLAGCRMQNADHIHPEWQHREVGETVLLHPANGLRVARFDPGRAYPLEGGWYFALEPLGPDRTRLLARGRIRRGFASAAYGLLLELPHFIMERKMLLGIKEAAER